MQAIIVTGGKQYVVNEGDTLFIEKLPVEAGDAVTFDQVLAIVDGENTKFGTPVVEGAKVEATVVKNGKGKKIRIFKYTPKKGSASSVLMLRATAVTAKRAAISSARQSQVRSALWKAP